ncbi:16S rRNA (guanine(966)-N(2))-methyltransferase RsmD [Buchnera aphidicola (Chaitophorus viminalis)]|nr:16S rRNA (guanine(966)-N(2))-methyltransferase RsmD [Buchnera aphidicola]MCW5197402.1 16S rRNA (guanine(966)-N(2))-methyltransferase RsmD [Buchnera aphidicola (Chaitophorus viminalis)]
MKFYENYKKKKFRKNTLHVISGIFKKQKISLKHSKNLRPTKNFIRETLFNWLNNYIQNAKCLDCFSGSGILGIEAVSRNAKFVTSLDIDIQNIYTIKKNLKKLKIKNIKSICVNTIHWLKKKSTPYDIIFLDPPYYKNNLLNKTIFLLENKKWTKKNTIIYIEKNISQENIKIPNNWILKKKKQTKKIEYKIYYKK